MHRGWLLVGLGRTTPHHHQTVTVVLSLETGDVVDNGHRLIPLAGYVLHPDAVKARYPTLVEDGFHRHDALEFARDRRQVGTFEHARCAGRFECVRGDWVPATKHKVVEVGKWDKLADEGVAILLLGAEADVRHLSDRADRRLQTLTSGNHAGDESGGHCAQAGRQNPQAACGRSNCSFSHRARISDHSHDGMIVKYF